MNDYTIPKPKFKSEVLCSRCKIKINRKDAVIIKKLTRSRALCKKCDIEVTAKKAVFEGLSR